MPEAEEVEVEIDPNELKIDVYRSTGPGGQSVNTTDSAVRITHVPTGLVVAMQDEKSQLQNKAKALRVLRARLFELERRKQREEQEATRRSQIGTGERAEKIRTYNYAESRVTDHRIKLTQHRLDAILDGELDEFTEAIAVRGPAAGARGVTSRELLTLGHRGARAGRLSVAARRRRVAARACARHDAQRAATPTATTLCRRRTSRASVSSWPAAHGASRSRTCSANGASAG